jgi:hypothetical protein
MKKINLKIKDNNDGANRYFFNYYLRIFFAIVFVGLIIYSLYCSYYGKLKKLLRFKNNNKD